LSLFREEYKDENAVLEKYSGSQNVPAGGKIGNFGKVIPGSTWGKM